MTKRSIKEPAIIALKDFRLNTQHYIEKVAKGEAFVVVKRSRPAFRLDPIDEQWETVADFTEINKGGVPAEDVLDAIDKITK